MSETQVGHGMSTRLYTVALVNQQTFEIKATPQRSAKTDALPQLGVIALILIASIGFAYSWRQGKKQAKKHMRAAGLNSDREEGQQPVKRSTPEVLER
jgi:hypothetical protein